MLVVKNTKIGHYIDRYKQFSTIRIIIISTLYTYILPGQQIAMHRAIISLMCHTRHACQVPQELYYYGVPIYLLF